MPSIPALCWPELSGDTPALQSIAKARRCSEQRLVLARRELAKVELLRRPGWGALALGSMGRREASPASDLDFTLVYDQDTIAPNEAEAGWQACISALSSWFDVPQKTFCRAMPLGPMCTHIGGAKDHHDQLTHRVLILTEGQWLSDPGWAEQVKAQLFFAYARGKVTRGRFLTSLSNDLNRYYRTICVDYRFKVEQQAKSWAMRLLKLRCSRKLWYLSNLAQWCWYVDQQRGARSEASSTEEDSTALDRQMLHILDWPPIYKLAFVLEHFGQGSSLAPLIECYGLFLSRLSDPELRQRLDALDYDARYASAEYRELNENAVRLDDACAVLVRELMLHSELYLLRYCLL